MFQGSVFQGSVFQGSVGGGCAADRERVIFSCPDQHHTAGTGHTQNTQNRNCREPHITRFCNTAPLHSHSRTLTLELKLHRRSGSGEAKHCTAALVFILPRGYFAAQRRAPNTLNNTFDRPYYLQKHSF